MKKIGFLAADVSKGYADFTLWNHEGKCLEPAFKLMDNKEGHLQIRQLVKDFMKRYLINELTSRYNISEEIMPIGKLRATWGSPRVSHQALQTEFNT